MSKIIEKYLPFTIRMLIVSTTGMTFMLGFSRLSRNYEISLAYVAIGFVCVMWVMYGVFERGNK